MVKVIPQVMAEQLSLLGVAGEGKRGDVAWDIFDELRDNVRLRLTCSSGSYYKQEGQERATKTQYTLFCSHSLTPVSRTM